MSIDEMPDELVLKTYKITLLQLKAEKLQLEVIEQYGCLHEGAEPDFCKKQHTMQKQMNLDAIAVFWNSKGALLADHGYEKITE